MYPSEKLAIDSRCPARSLSTLRLIYQSAPHHHSPIQDEAVKMVLSQAELLCRATSLVAGRATALGGLLAVVHLYRGFALTGEGQSGGQRLAVGRKLPAIGLGSLTL